jgi:histidinol phosphatase-like PHP family hydrolase
MTKADVRLAVESGVCLEITTRKGNALANGHVAMLAKRHGAKLVVNNDFHTPGEYVGLAMATKILRGAGLTEDEAKQVIQNGNELFRHKLGSTR